MVPVKIRQELINFLRRLPAEPRHKLKMAIKGLGEEKGDIRALTDDLEGFYRLSVGRYRVIFQYEIHGGSRLIYGPASQIRKTRSHTKARSHEGN